MEIDIDYYKVIKKIFKKKKIADSEYPLSL